MRLTILASMFAVAALAACAKKEEAIVYQEPVSVEPVYTGKYK